ncbi:MAG: SRPBCC domain-containing protein [Bacteroidales bacterium]|nr:SRPBCC domain-containing protein [Bacteroidales bacterium]
MSELVQYQLEFVINTSPKVLYSRLSSPAGLSEWFADDVNVRGEVFTFIWEDSEEKAKIIAKKENVFIKFQWISKSDEKAFLEFRIQSEELTGDVSLVITDYAESEERTDAIDLWEKQIAYLKHTLGILN